MKKIIVMVTILVGLVEILYYLRSSDNRDMEIQGLKYENETLRKTLQRANSDIMRANQIIAGDSVGTLLKGADGRVLYY